MSTLYLPTPVMPVTATLLRAVFGTHTVELQNPPLTKAGEPSGFTHMEAALLGVDYVKLLIAGTTKLPVLTLVGNGNGMIGVFLVWLRQTVGLQVTRCTTLDELRTASLNPGLVLADANSSEELLTLMHLVNSTTDVCMFPNDPQRHQHVRVQANLALRCNTAPDPAKCRTLHWVRHVEGDALAEKEAHAMLEKMSWEYRHLLDMMYYKPFLTKPTTDLWFGAEQLEEAQPQTI